MKKAVLTLYAVAYLHPGAGSTTDVIDLPIQREVHSGLPVISASSLKGALRQKASESGSVEVLFGPDTGYGDKHAGAVSLGEAKLLALPVRSLRNIFQWVSSPLILERLRRDLARLDVQLPEIPVPNEGQALVPTGGDGSLILEELDFETSESDALGEILLEIREGLLPKEAGDYLLDKFVRDFALVGDEEMRHLCRVGTQVQARIQLNENKTSKNLWYEESLPPETIFYAVALVENSRDGSGLGADELMRAFEEAGVIASGGLIQIGGNETVGQGWCYGRLSHGGEGNR